MTKLFLAHLEGLVHVVLVDDAAHHRVNVFAMMGMIEIQVDAYDRLGTLGDETMDDTAAKSGASARDQGHHALDASQIRHHVSGERTVCVEAWQE